MAYWASAVINPAISMQDQLHNILVYKQSLYYYNPEPFLRCAHCRGLCTQRLSQIDYLIDLAIRIEENLLIIRDVLHFKCRYD